MEVQRQTCLLLNNTNISVFYISNIMITPKIDFSDREERLSFVLERYKCQYPNCGSCGSCNLPNGKPAIEIFHDYIEGKVEFATIAAGLWS